MIGTEENKKNYINDKISKWTKEINMLTDIATTHPQATQPISLITNISWHTSHELFPVLGTSLRGSMRLYDINWFLLSLVVTSSTTLRVMLSLPTRLGGSDLKIFAETAENEYKDSTRITSNLQAQFLEWTTTRARLEVKRKLNVMKEVKENYVSSWQHQMKKQKEWWKLLIKKGFRIG